MKAVLMSIQPKWCELIASGQKAIEIRKTRPKLEVPFKVYIYCTKAKDHFSIGGGIYATSDTLYRLPTGEIKFGDGFELMGDWSGQYDESNFLNGKVIGEFVCDAIRVYGYDEHNGYPTPAYEGDPSFLDCGPGYWITCGELKDTYLSEEEFEAYGNKNTLYGWHITDLVIYNRPKGLRNFTHACPDTVRSCLDCKFTKDGWECKRITKPPQSWCYVDELTNDT